VGAKRAERICFELKSKVERKFSSLIGRGVHAGSPGPGDGGVIMGLMGLGFSQGEATKAIELCRREAGESALCEEELMMAALNRLQRI
jgi:Holliday junction DNA helicase RuvA